MKINEVCSPLKTYTATVRVVTTNSSTTARTSIPADNQLQARLMLTRLYGVGNILTLIEVVSKSPRIYEIHARDKNTPPSTQAQHRSEKTDSAQFSCVSEAGADTRVLSPDELQVKTLADQAKRIDQQAKLKKAQIKVQKAQNNLRRASSVQNLSG